MSNIFSDPPFRRGSTLLVGGDIETDDVGPVAGRQMIGQVKVFQDVDPFSGQRFSNRLVYCVAARYTGTTDLDPVASRGFLYRFNSGSMAEFSALISAAQVAAGWQHGALDEYLTMTVRPNDIVWLVVKGPTTIQKQDGSSVAAGGTVQVLASATGRVLPLSTGVAVAQSIEGAAVTGATGTTMRVNKICPFDFT